MENNSALLPVCAGKDDDETVSKQSRIHRIRSRSEECERCSVEYVENVDKGTRVGTNQQIRDG